MPLIPPEYSYRLTDPLLFYKNVCGNVETAFTRDKIDSQLKSELLTALQNLPTPPRRGLAAKKNSIAHN